MFVCEKIMVKLSCSVTISWVHCSLISQCATPFLLEESFLSKTSLNYLFLNEGVFFPVIKKRYMLFFLNL